VSVSTAPTVPTEVQQERSPSAEAAPPAPVVVGVDGSECGLVAAQWAAREAALRGAPLRIVHAATYLGRSDNGSSPELPRARRITAKAYTAARRAAPDTKATTEIVPDEPVNALLNAAAESQLLVLGISTTGAADELILAPVAQRVAARASCPLVVVPRQKGATPAGRPVVAILGLGDQEDDEAVAAFAADAARRAGSTVSVIQTRTGAEDKRDERFPGLDVNREELPHATGVRLLGDACPTPLLVLTARQGGLLHRGLSGAHRWLLRHCTSPMALVPPADRTAARSGEGAARR
jgi:nucleotide-binding universal stress UspA family protein